MAKVVVDNVRTTPEAVRAAITEFADLVLRPLTTGR